MPAGARGCHGRHLHAAAALNPAYVRSARSASACATPRGTTTIGTGEFGGIDVAEDAVQDASALALRRWPADGHRPNPGGWITTTARGVFTGAGRRAGS
jgi:predicted RNA polymerase sigma factor